MKTIEQLKAEAEQAQIALQAAEREAQEAERAKQEAERQQREEQRRAAERAKTEQRRQVVRAALHEHGVDLDESMRYGSAQVSLVEQYSKISSWRSSPTGKFTLIVSCNDWAMHIKDTRYPPTKSGYSWAKIAERIKEINEQVTAQRLHEKQQAAAKQAAQQQLKTLQQRLDEAAVAVKHTRIEATYEVGTHDYRGRWHSTTYVAPQGKVFVSVPRQAVTPEQAAEIAKAVAKIMTQKEI